MAEKPSGGQTSDVYESFDLAHRFDCLTRYRSVLVAVSGGADSVALLLLIARWADTQSTCPEIEVATVDHGLRTNSAEEANWVAQVSSSLGLRHHVARWTGEKPASGLQAAARTARYQLLTDVVNACGMAGPSAIVTAHSQDDQAETVVMRLARGSGVDGLAGMKTVRSLPGVQGVDLVRPLLDVSKHDLVGLLTDVGQDWLEDPSNQSPDFERVRVRQAMGALADVGLTAPALARVAMRAERAATALQSQTEAFIDGAVALNGGICAEWATTDFLAQAREIQIRVLRQVLSGFGGQAPEARLQQVEALQASLLSKERVTATLGGCVVSKTDGRVTVHRESGRQPLPTLPLQVGETKVWDGRFLVSLTALAPGAGDAMGQIEVRPLGPELYGALRPYLSGQMVGAVPRAAAATLPSFWVDGRLLAVPPLNVDQALLRDSGGADLSAFLVAAPDGHGVCTVDCRAAFVGLKECQIGT